jgi:hypothetical protein
LYEHHHAKFLAIDGVDEWLKEYHSGLWYRSGFNPTIKCDYITNNIAEVFDNWIKDHKDLPVCDLAGKIRVMHIEPFHKRRLPCVVSLLIRLE